MTPVLKKQKRIHDNTLLNIACVMGVTFLWLATLWQGSWFLGFFAVIATVALAAYCYFESKFVEETVYGDWDHD